MDRTRRLRLSRLGTACFLGGVLACLGAGAQPEPRPLPAKVLRIVSRTPLPAGQSVPTDIRWASDDSVYVSWYLDGVAEVGLDGTRRRSLFPNARTFGLQEHYKQLAVSPETLIAAPHHFAFYSRPLVSEKGAFQVRKHEITYALDLDLRGDRMLFLGVPIEGRPRHGRPFAPDGGVAWIGTLKSELQDLRPLLHDRAWKGVPSEKEFPGGAPTFFQCRHSLLGAVRFLDDSSFVVVPGFQKGAHLFNPQGERVRSWTSEEIGLDTDCSAVDDEEEEKMRLDTAYWLDWLNSHRVLDDILPLPQGPGLLVRSGGEDGRASWSLKVLTPTRVEIYAVPIRGTRRSDRLHGDVRNGRIVLLLSAWGVPFNRAAATLPAEILVAEMPEGGNHAQTR